MSVPDSCCHTESPGCGRNLFQTTDLKNIVERIHAHGCLTIMQVRLKTHVSVITIIITSHMYVHTRFHFRVTCLRLIIRKVLYLEGVH